MNAQIQFFHQGVEQTTRHELLAKYPYLSWSRLQRLLNHAELATLKVIYKNQFYFEKAATEEFIERMTIDFRGIDVVASAEGDHEAKGVLLETPSRHVAEAALETYPTFTDEDTFWA